MTEIRPTKVTDLHVGDLVIFPFQTKIVEHVTIVTSSIVDDDGGRGWPGVTVTWSNRSQTSFRLDAIVDVEQ